MTQEEVAIIWKDANGWDVKGYETTLKDLERFAKLVAAKEREACAKLVKDYMKETAIMEARGCLASVAYDIRARGEA